MRRAFWGGAVTVLGLCSIAPSARAAGATASGTCKYKDKSFTVSDGVVFQEPDPFDKAKKRTKISLSSKALDHAKLEAAKDVDSELTHQAMSGDGSQLQIGVGEDGTASSLYVYIPPGSNLSKSGNALGTLKLSRNDAKGAAGSFQTPPSKDADELSCDVTFDLALVEPRAKAPGKALAAGGGEAGKAYLAYVAAMKKGDVDALAKLMPKDRADAMLSHRKDPDFKEKLGFMQTMAPKTIKIVGGSESPTGADLNVEGEDADGNPIDGTATMTRDGAAWRLQEENLVTHVK